MNPDEKAAREALAVLTREPDVDARGDVVVDVPLALARRAAMHAAGEHLRVALALLDTERARVAELEAACEEASARARMRWSIAARDEREE